jgi:carboxyl-terminal processing protease
MRGIDHTWLSGCRLSGGGAKTAGVVFCLGVSLAWLAGPVMAAPSAPVPKKPAVDPAPPTRPAAPPAVVASATPATSPAAGYEGIEQLARVIELVRQNYVDEGKVSYERLVASALEGMLRDLDPHSQFLHPGLYEQLQQEQSSTYEGVGITIAEKNGAVLILAVREDGPAARVGVRPGDQLIEVDGTLLKEKGLPEASRLLRGKPGAVLRLTVSRPSTKETKAFEMIRQVLSAETIKDARILSQSSENQPIAPAKPLPAGPAGSASSTPDKPIGEKLAPSEPKIGYLRLLQFKETSPRELSTALDALEDQGMQALIFDLRNNPGGLVDAAVAIAGEFLPPKTIVMTMEGRAGTTLHEPYRTAPRQRRQRVYPVAILVNHSSASASELVSGALQDLKRALIVGETTFGKGSVQSIIPVEGGAAVRLTTALYYTPSHRLIHGHGIEPDILAPLTSAEETALFESWTRGPSISPSGSPEIPPPDPTLQRAVAALRTRLKP